MAATLVLASVFSIVGGGSEAVLLEVDPAKVLDYSVLTGVHCLDHLCDTWIAAEIPVRPGDVVCAEPPLGVVRCVIAAWGRIGAGGDGMTITVSVAGPAKFALISCRNDGLRLGRLVLERPFLGPDKAIGFYFRENRPPIGRCFWEALCFFLAKDRKEGT